MLFVFYSLLKKTFQVWYLAKVGNVSHDNLNWSFNVEHVETNSTTISPLQLPVGQLPPNVSTQACLIDSAAIAQTPP